MDNLKNSTILIVDDTPENIDILVDILSDYNKTVAIDGEDALETIFENELPDLILLDVMMPKMDGFEVCRYLRLHDKTKDIPIIFLTAKTNEEDIIQGFEAGGQDYVAKPFYPSELLARVSTQLLLKQKRDELRKINATLEDKVLQRTQDLLKAKNRAEESDRLKSEFLSSMTHEIRTPLNAICGFSKVIAESVDDPDLVSYSNLIQSQNDLLLKLIDDIIDFAKIESNSLELDREHFDLNELILELYGQYLPDIKEGIELMPLTSDDTLTVFSDKLRIKQVFINLISNAIKFTRKGTVSFGIESISDAEVCCFVKDTGLGISKENQQVIFERFRKIDTFSQGTGLGLSIAYNIVELTTGNKLYLESEPDVGSYFHFLMPLLNNKSAYSSDAGDEMFAPSDKELTI